MTPRQIGLVKQTWQQLQPLGDNVAELFYARLFELDPTLRSMFKGDMSAQRRKLTNVLDFAVTQLDRLPSLVPMLRALGQRHTTYGVQDRHYPIVGAALLDTLAAGLKDDFTPEVKEAWAAVYATLAATMKSGAAQKPAALAA